MEDSAWDRKWGNQGGGGGSPLRNKNGKIVTDLRNNGVITRANVSKLSQQRAKDQRTEQRYILEKQIAERAKRKQKQKLEDQMWDMRYGNGNDGNDGNEGRGMTAIERRETEQQQVLQQQNNKLQAQQQQLRLLEEQQQKQQQQQQQVPLASPRDSLPPDFVVLKPLRATVVSGTNTTATMDNRTADQVTNDRNVAHALANPDKNIQFMTSEAKAAVDDIKRQQYLAELAIQIEEQKDRKRREKRREMEEDRQRAEASRGYMPWGRQGHGAPLRDTGGQVITNLRKQNSRHPPSKRNIVYGGALGNDYSKPSSRLSNRQQQQHRQQCRQPSPQPPQPHPQPLPQSQPPQSQPLLSPSSPLNRMSAPSSKLVASQRDELLRLRAENGTLRTDNLALRDELYAYQNNVEILENMLAKYKAKFGTL